MFENFTERARKVVSLARQEAEITKSEFIGTEHILLGIMADGGGLGFEVLRKLKADIAVLRADIDGLILGRSQAVLLGQIPFSPRAKFAIEQAMEFASKLGSLCVGTEHLLVGLMKDYENLAFQAIRQHLGVHPSFVVDQVLHALGVPVEEKTPAKKDSVKIRILLYTLMDYAVFDPKSICAHGERYAPTGSVGVSDLALADVPNVARSVAGGLGCSVYQVVLE